MYDKTIKNYYWLFIVLRALFDNFGKKVVI